MQMSLLEELPTELAEFTLRFLTGFDLLHLSHTNRNLYNGLLNKESVVWKRLVVSPTSGSQRQRLDETSTAKHRYFAQRSIRFYGCRSDIAFHANRGGAILAPTLDTLSTNGSFVIDLSFALLPDLDRVYSTIGGVLIGAQSVPVYEDRWGRQHAGLIHVDPYRRLYCSVTNDTKVVVGVLRLQRWYHLTLVVEAMETPLSTEEVLVAQRVYVDGELMHSSVAPLHADWSTLTNVQLGTGCITGGALGVGWYAFNGLVDDCRFYDEAISEEQIRRLASGELKDKATTWIWSARDVQAKAACGRVALVSCTRPTERVSDNITTLSFVSQEKIPRRTPLARRA